MGRIKPIIGATLGSRSSCAALIFWSIFFFSVLRLVIILLFLSSEERMFVFIVGWRQMHENVTASHDARTLNSQCQMVILSTYIKWERVQ